jgi:hypothetical protein
MCVAVFLVAGTDFFIGQYLQLVLEKSPFVAGLWLLPGSEAWLQAYCSRPPSSLARAEHTSSSPGSRSPPLERLC